MTNKKECASYRVPNMAEKIANEVSRMEKNKPQMTEENKSGVTINFNPTIVVEGPTVHQSSETESTDNRTKNNSSMSEVSALLTGLASVVLPMVMKIKK